MPKHYFAAMTRNTISLVGTALVVGSLTLILSLIAVELLGLRGGAYLGIVTFVLLPAVLLVGLILIPIGIRRERRRVAAGQAGGEGFRFPVLDMNNERTRKSVIGLLVLSTLSLVVLAAATYKGIEVMDSTAFALCMDNNLPIIVFNMADGTNIDKIVSGERVGTLVRT